MNIIPCPFCQTPCRRVHEDKYSFSHAATWQCDYHGSSIVRVVNQPDPESPYTHLIIFPYKDHFYYASFFFNLPPNNPKFQVDKAYLKHNKPLNKEPVFTLEFHPNNINPDNIQKKLSLYMVFA